MSIARLVALIESITVAKTSESLIELVSKIGTAPIGVVESDEEESIPGMGTEFIDEDLVVGGMMIR